MNFNTVLFDLDGTLLSMDVDAFEKVYIGSLAKTVSSIINPEDFVKALWTATGAMVQNDGTTTNEVLFYSVFKSLVGEEAYEKSMPFIDAYYEDTFDVASSATGSNDSMIEAVKILKSKGYRLIIATNPMFPKMAVYKRVLWAGLNWDDFELVTSFETSHYCKPNPKYYEEIGAKRNLDLNACLMVGNDAQEDLVSRTLGMKTYLLDDELIHRGGDIETDYRGNRQEFLEFVKGL